MASRKVSLTLSIKSCIRDGMTPPSIVCPACGRRSYNPGDIEHRYCAVCGWHADLDDPLRETARLLRRSIEREGMAKTFARIQAEVEDSTDLSAEKRAKYRIRGRNH